MGSSKEMFNKLLFHDDFHSTINDISKLNINFPKKPVDFVATFDEFRYPPDGSKVTQLEEKKKYSMNVEEGFNSLKSYLQICSYDESFHKFNALEGTAYLTSHSLVYLGEDDYLPYSKLSFNFYTRSKTLSQNSKYITCTMDPESEYKTDYVKDRFEILTNNVPEKTLLLIDGPLMGKQMTGHTLTLTKELLKKEVIPIFFVKNSNSNLITEYIKEFSGIYNSDMHYAYNLLHENERTSLYKYHDFGGNKAKIFCYLKTFNVSPQRIEFDNITYLKYRDEINAILNLINYLIICQGDLKNPQVRPIAIAEKFARSTIHLYNIYDLMKLAGARGLIK